MLADQEERREKRERELLARGREEGETCERRKLVARLFASGMSVSQISELIELDEAEITRLLD